MPNVSYEIYYKFPGISINDPLAEKKSTIDIEQDLDWATSRLKDEFSGINEGVTIDRVRGSGTMVVSISSDISLDRISDELKEVLLEVGLFGKPKTT